MQAALKIFEFPFKGSSGNGAQKIGVKFPNCSSADAMGEENGFIEVMAALTKMPPKELQASLDQLDWVPIDENSGEFVPLIDLTAQIGQKNSIVNILWPQHNFTASAEAKQAEQSGNTGLSFSRISSGRNPKLAHQAVDEDVKTRFFNHSGGDNRSASSQKPDLTSELAMLPKPDLNQAQSSSEFLGKGIRLSQTQLASHSNHGVQQRVDTQIGAPTDQNTARLPLADRVIKKTMDGFEQFPKQAANESTAKNSQALRSNAFEKISHEGMLKMPARAMAASSGSAIESHMASDTTDHAETASANRQGIKSQTQHSTRIASIATLPQQTEGLTAARDIAAAQGANSQEAERAKAANLKGLMRVDQSAGQKDNALTINSSDGTDAQSNNASTREGTPSFDSRLATATTSKAIEQGGAAKEVLPFIDKESNTDVIRQIVQRMTLRTEKQQSQMTIQLKPDFLGNVRLHVTTENQLVMVRMEAESMVVKDIIEHNMPHLKAELQQHGLEIEKFDVFVGSDNDDSRNGQQQAGLRQGLKRNSNKEKFDEMQNENKEKDESSSSGDNRKVSKTTNNLEVDYFA